MKSIIENTVRALTIQDAYKPRFEEISNLIPTFGSGETENLSSFFQCVEIVKDTYEVQPNMLLLIVSKLRGYTLYWYP